MAEQHPHILRAIRDVGSQAELARRCRCAQQHISKLLNGENAISAQMAIAISAATEGRVLIADLLPEVVAAVARELDRPPVAA